MNFLSLVIVVVCLFFVVSCGLIRKSFTSADSNSNSAANSNASNMDAAKSPADDKEKFQKLLDAGKEIEKAAFSVKRDPKPTLKGKVFVFSNVEAKIGNDYSDGISSYRKADSLEKLQTAIRVNCRKGKSLGDFSNNSNNFERRIKGYGIECDVALIDYPSRTIFDQKTFSNSENQEAVSSKQVTGDVYLNPPPFGEITQYLNSLPVDKVIPGMTLLDEKELIRLPTTLGLKPDAALKGKIKFARLYGEADISMSPIKIDDYWYKWSNNPFPSAKIAVEPADLETLVKIVCGKGDKISQMGKTPQYGNRCEISVIDYKTLTVIAQKVVENKTLDDDPSAKDAGAKIWVTKFPKTEVDDYLKSLPTS